ncbi:carbonic anhydrase family protein [Hydrogenophilus islandicus]
MKWGLRWLTGAMVVGAVALAYAAEGAHWSYHGKGGPAEWGKLDKAYVLCGIGKNQSPIDIDRVAVLRTDLRPLAFEYEAPLPLTVEDNGHTIVLPVSGGKWTLRAEGQSFALVNLHFHSPSEHADSGNRYPLEAHFVHRNAAGELAVVGVWFRSGDENPALTQILRWVPEAEPRAQGGKAAAPSHRQEARKRVSNETIDLRGLLPRSEGYFRYNGSLTTPPCSEGVRWYVMQEPLSASEAQLMRFRELLNDNARPLQPINARRVLE